tara:strand:- start:342 stop:581 length:240 start_codon:yes stop_codon:yes gene_type:complete
MNRNPLGISFTECLKRNGGERSLNTPKTPSDTPTRRCNRFVGAGSDGSTISPAEHQKFRQRTFQIKFPASAENLSEIPK